MSSQPLEHIVEEETEHPLFMTPEQEEKEADRLKIYIRSLDASPQEKARRFADEMPAQQQENDDYRDNTGLYL